MVITTRPYRLDDPAYAVLYVRRALLVPIELGMAGSLALIGIGLLGNHWILGILPLLVAISIFGLRFVFKPGLAERYVQMAQAGGRIPVTRVAKFGDDGFVIRPEAIPEGSSKGVNLLLWERLDRIEREDGYVFLLPLPASPRGFAVPESSFDPGDLDALLAFWDAKKAARLKTEGSKAETANS